MSMSREDRLALLNSEVFQELEMAERRKLAQSLSDKIIQSPTAQKAISDGITKALSKADDGMEEHHEVRANIKKLDDHLLVEFCQMFQDEIDARDLDVKDFEKKEDEETEEDEEAEDEKMEDVFAYVKSSLTRLAYSAADSGNTEAAHLIERFLQKIS